jgi:hypothetical protein
MNAVECRNKTCSRQTDVYVTYLQLVNADFQHGSLGHRGALLLEDLAEVPSDALVIPLLVHGIFNDELNCQDYKAPKHRIINE